MQPDCLPCPPACRCVGPTVRVSSSCPHPRIVGPVDARFSAPDRDHGLRPLHLERALRPRVQRQVDLAILPPQQHAPTTGSRQRTIVPIGQAQPLAWRGHRRGDREQRQQDLVDDDGAIDRNPHRRHQRRRADDPRAYFFFRSTLGGAVARPRRPNDAPRRTGRTAESRRPTQDSSSS